MPKSVHVAGTNGKGSTIAFLRYILQEAGYRVHVYTSPHLLDFNERIVLAGHKISDRYLYEMLEECRSASEGIPITLFEAATVAAFLSFANVDADIALIETGMGGRLDATNVVDAVISIITSISLEHTAFLGPTVELIAAEKAGIIKPHMSCVVAPQEPSVMAILEYYAANNQVQIYRGDIDWSCVPQDGKILFCSKRVNLELPEPALLGEHQVINAGNAIAACCLLRDDHGYNIAADHISGGVQKARWPARLEHITENRLARSLPKQWRLFLDGAHNPAGGQVIGQWLKNNVEKEAFSLIIGMTEDKDSKAFIKHFVPHVDTLYTVCVQSEPRSQPAPKLANSAIEMGLGAIPCGSIADAVEKILASADQEKPRVILICGSLFLAGDLSKA